MRFEKMHGAGNDFIMVDARGEARDWPALARATCDRHFGIGADGLILVLPSDRADFQFRIFNPDGSEAEMCGNGIRCFGKYVAEHELWPLDRPDLVVDTGAGLLPLHLMVQGSQVIGVRVGMGAPRLRPADLPVLVEGAGPVLDYPLAVDGERFSINCVSMGNPHAVAFIHAPVGEYPLEQIGPKVEHHPLFPRRVNFEIVNVVGPGRLRVRVWERGAGLTLACGTGACAVAVAARLRGLAQGDLAVELPGGELSISWDGQGEVQMTGPAEFVFAGEWPESRDHRLAEISANAGRRPE